MSKMQDFTRGRNHNIYRLRGISATLKTITGIAAEKRQILMGSVSVHETITEKERAILVNATGCIEAVLQELSPEATTRAYEAWKETHDDTD